jgi:hypothetical protein
VSTMCLQCVYNVSTMCLQCVYNVSTMCLQCVYDVSTMCLQCVYNVSTMCLQWVYIYFVLVRALTLLPPGLGTRRRWFTLSYMCCCCSFLGASVYAAPVSHIMHAGSDHDSADSSESCLRKGGVPCPAGIESVSSGSNDRDAAVAR